MKTILRREAVQFIVSLEEDPRSTCQLSYGEGGSQRIPACIRGGNCALMLEVSKQLRLLMPSEVHHVSKCILLLDYYA